MNWYMYFYTEARAPPESTSKLIFFLLFKVSKGAKIRNRYNQVPHLTQDTNGKVKFNFIVMLSCMVFKFNIYLIFLYTFDRVLCNICYFRISNYKFAHIFSNCILLNYS